MVFVVVVGGGGVFLFSLTACGRFVVVQKNDIGMT